MMKDIGFKGERVATEYLLSKGFRILNENFHSRQGEIDIIAIDHGSLVFVEVKTRSSNLESALSSVSRSKQRKLTLAAMAYLRAHPEYEDSLCRFDVVGVLSAGESLQPRIVHLRDAFRPDSLE